MNSSEALPARYPAIRQEKAWEYPAPSEAPTIKPEGRVLPGTGMVKDQFCGEVRSVAVCSANPVDHEKRKIRHSCNRLECPICHARTLSRNAEAVGSRVNGYRQALMGQRTIDGQQVARPRPPRHGVLSPPMSVINAVYDRTIKALDRKHPDGYTAAAVQQVFIEKFRYEAYKALDLLGVDGASVIIHFDRVSDQGKTRYTDAGTDDKIWKWIRQQPDFRDLIRLSPHVHLIYYGTSMPTGDFYEASGSWVFKMRREVEDVPRLASYLLSHAPVINGRVSVTYWGCLSARKLEAVSTYTEKEEVLCETCGSILVHASIDDKGNVLHVTDRPLYHKHRVRVYVIKKPGELLSRIEKSKYSERAKWLLL